MKFGLEAPATGALAGPGALAAVSAWGEELGFDHLAVGDHIVIPRDIASRYPYTESGEFAGEWAHTEESSGTGIMMEQLTVLAYLAALTERIRLLASVTVLPYRQPVLTAKILATIDVLSEGRLDVGCGAGWMEEEFIALDSPPFRERGAVASEYISAFRELWSSDEPTFCGKYVHFENIAFEPKPVQTPGPPIWIGGESPPAVRRAARCGDVWYPFGNNPRHRLDSMDRLREGIDRLRSETAAAGRLPDAVKIAYSAEMFYSDAGPQYEADGTRRLLTGEPGQVAEDILALAELGVEHLMLDFEGATLDETRRRMERFASMVRPLAEGSARAGMGIQ